MDKFFYIKDRSQAQWGFQLNDGRIISLFDENNQFHLRFDDVINLETGEIVSKCSQLTSEDIENGYTTLNQLIREKKGHQVFCHDTLDYDDDVYMDDENVDERADVNKIRDFFVKHGYNVTTEAVSWCVSNWKCGFKSGYRDDVNGYHLFNPCGGNPLSIRLTTLHPLCEDWQKTYWC